MFLYFGKLNFECLSKVALGITIIDLHNELKITGDEKGTQL